VITSESIPLPATRMQLHDKLPQLPRFSPTYSSTPTNSNAAASTSSPILPPASPAPPVPLPAPMPPGPAMEDATVPEVPPLLR